MLRFTTYTLGCKVNQYETQYVREGLLRLGYEEAEEGGPADLCVVNTCTVTAEGDLKSRKIIRQLARQNPAAEIVVMGCYAARAAHEVAALPGVTEVVTDKRRLPDLLARLGLADVPAGISGFGRRHRAYVKVQDGCRLKCSYCIIPSVRPVLESRAVDDVVEEVRRLVAAGHREIVLTGIHLGHYGIGLRERVRPVRRGSPTPPQRTTEGLACWLGTGANPRFPSARPSLARLVARLADLDGDFRVRLSSLEAAEVGPELIDVMAARPDRVCPHLHLSLQSGSDAVLARMRRRYTSAWFVDRCLRIREALDRPALTTDVIVGFPGETEADFEATCRVVEAAGFSKIHVFRFSPRQGTPAADLPDQVPGQVKHRRAADLAALGERLRASFFAGLLGRRVQALVEGTVPQSAGPGLLGPDETAGQHDDSPLLLAGTSERYAPVELAGPKRLVGRLVDVLAVEASAAGIRGHLEGIRIDPLAQTW